MAGTGNASVAANGLSIPLAEPTPDSPIQCALRLRRSREPPSTDNIGTFGDYLAYP